MIEIAIWYLGVCIVVALCVATIRLVWVLLVLLLTALGALFDLLLWPLRRRHFQRVR